MAQTVLCAHWHEVSNLARAKTECSALIKRHPDFAPALTLAGDIALQEGDPLLATQRYQHAVEQGVGADALYAKIRLALLRPGTKNTELLAFVNEIKRKIEHHDEDPEQALRLAMLYVGLGQLEAGMAALEAAVLGGYSNRHTLESDPHLAALRRDAQFGRVLGLLNARLEQEHKKMLGLMGNQTN